MLTTNNMGRTFLSLFSEFERAELCQLYIHRTIPDEDVCSSFFQVTDYDVLKALPFAHPGREIVHALIEEQIENGTSHGSVRRGNAGSIARILRDIMWSFSRWYSPKLMEWIDKEKPTCIFVAPGYAKFIYDIAIKIANAYNLSIVTYICDDYYFVNTPNRFIDRLQLSLLRKKTKQLMSMTDRLVVISEELKNIYQDCFNVPTDVIMTGGDHINSFDSSKSEQNLKVSYFGNLSAGRSISLAEIGRAIDVINNENQTNITLQIYSPETSENRLMCLCGIGSVKLCGFVSGVEFNEAFSSSNLLIHTESFDEANVDLVKHSVSTKIADSLASGIPLFAYGPDSISSMKHLIRNDCAIVATSKDQLKTELEKALFNKDVRRDVVDNALRTASEFHNKQKNSEKLKSIFHEVEALKIE